MWSTIIICAILVLVCVYTVRSYIKKLRHGCCGGGDGEVKRIRPADKNLAHYSYVSKIEIEGMSCKNCAYRIENAFNEIENYYAEVKLKEKIATVWMKQKVTDDELKRIIERVGYKAVRVETAQKPA